MNETLLQTKLYIPPLRPSLVPRPHLIERLNRGRQGKLTLVSAPPGYGKTTLIASWITQPAGPSCGWLSLDVDDNESLRFGSYLVAALRCIDPQLGLTAVGLLGSPQLLRLEDLLTLLINDLTALAEQAVLVLDDYHLINNLDVHNALAFLLEHQPPQLHLVICSQADPPFPLTRLRVREQVNDIRVSDLRFTADEAGAFLNDRARLGLDAADVVALESRTEGWIAGLQLAALSLYGRADKSQAVATFAGSHHHIIDYLSEDVLQQQPHTLQTFLLRTSILDRLCGPLCDAVTGREDGQVVLESLERQNLFLSNQDDVRQWYRYHPLFAEFLRIQLQRREARFVATLHLRAARWFEGQDLVLEAIRHALAAQDYMFAGALIQRAAEETLWLSGQWSTLLQWTQALPDEVLYARPRLGLYYAWALFTTGQIELLEQVLSQVERSVTTLAPEDLRTDMLGEAATLRACVRFERGDLAGSIVMAQKALAHLANDNIMTQAAAKYVLALAYSGRGDWRLALPALQETIATSQAGGNVAVALMASGSLAQLLASLGYLHRAVAVYRQARQLAEPEPGLLLGTVGVACLAMGEVLREWNDLEQAGLLLREGIHLCRQQRSMPELVLEGTLTLTRVLWAQGNHQAAEKELQQAMTQMAALRSRDGDVRPLIAAAMDCLARHLLAKAEPAQAAYWIAEGRLEDEDARPYWRLRNNLLLARLHLAQGQAGAAQKLLEQLLLAAAAAEQPRLAVEGLMLNGLAWQALGDTGRAWQDVSAALVLAAQEGYVRLFVDEGEPVRRLLQRFVGGDHSLDYAARLLAAFPGPASAADGMPMGESRQPAIPGGVAEIPPPLNEPLTERELVILRLMAAGLSNAEIAHEQYLAVNTVKWYASRLYRKLDVTRRAQAVLRAQQLGIL